MKTTETGLPIRELAIDSYSPAEIAHLIDSKGVTKANLDVFTTLALSVLAGAFIALGAVFSTLVGTGSALGFGPTRLMMGLAFSLGLVLVVVGGAELFTGNNLIIMSWVSRRISLKRLLRNWLIVYAGNLLGALSIVALVYFARWWELDGGRVGILALSIAYGKVGLSFPAAFFRGVLANALVCLAVWLASSGRSVIDKVLAIVFPITAFVASGFEHSVANMYFIPLGILLGQNGDLVQAAGLSAEGAARLNLPWFLHNLAASTLGNIVGGSGLVGLVYWYIFLRGAKDRT